jgi:hypothetical protein
MGLLCIIRHVCRVHHISGGPPYQVGPYAGPSWGVFYELRVARSDVVSLSLSRRNAASESAKKPWLVARGSWLVKAHHHSKWAVVKYHSGPPFGTAPTSHEPRTTNNKKSTSRRPTSPAESRTSLSGCIPSHHQVTRFGISDSHGFARRKAPSKPVPCLSQGTLVG